MKHRRELLLAGLPTLFAVHQFIEGFVWLSLDGTLPATMTRPWGAAYMLYAQGLLPFGVFLFEADVRSRKRMLPFVFLGGITALYMLWALIAFSTSIYVQSDSIVYINDGYLPHA